MPTEEKNPWEPLPAGVYMAAAFGLFSILLLVGSVLYSDVFSGVASLLLGGAAIHSTADAAHHAGMRRESYWWKKRNGF